MITLGCDRETAQKVFDAYWGLNWAIKEVADELIHKTSKITGKMWLWNPVAKLWYPLKHVKDKFSTLVQGTASFLFDTWVALYLNKRPNLLGQFHDEFIFEIREGNEQRAIDLLKDCIDKVNKTFKLNRELDIDIKFGKRYSEIH